MGRGQGLGRGGLVGRHAEVATIERTVTDLDSGRFRCLTISGEPGIGKTRLADELGRIACERNYVVLRGRATALQTDLPFGVLVDALDPRIGELELVRLSPERAAELAFIFPALLGRVARPVSTLQVERYRLHHAVRTAIEELAAQRPLVLALDDLQWADEASSALIASLVHRPPEGPVLLVLVHRRAQLSRPLTSVLATAERQRAMERLELAPLTVDAARELIGGEVDVRRREALIRAGGGNPFYLEELARDSAVASTSSGPGAPAVDRTGLPLPVREAIGEELAALGTTSRALLSAGAVTGDPFDVDLAATVAGLSEDQGLDVLDELLARDLVRAGEVPRAYAFRHPIVRDAVYESVDLEARLHAHSRAAAALARRGAPAAARAPHVEQSARRGDEDAIVLLTVAARDTAALAPATAARWYGAAWHLLPDDADELRRLGLLLPLVSTLATVGRIDQSRAVAVEALELVPEEMDDLRIRILVQIARAEHMLVGPEQARRSLLAALERRPSARSAALLRLEIGVRYWHEREAVEMSAWAEAAGRDAARAGDAVLEAEAEAMRALAERARWNVPAAELHAGRAEELIAGAPDTDLAPRLEGLLLLGLASHELERFERAIEHLERALQLSRLTGQNYFCVPLMVGLGMAQVHLGRLSKAVDCAEEAVEAALLMGDDLPLMWALALHCWTATVMGDRSAAADAGAATAAVVERMPDAAYAPIASCIRGLFRISDGDVEGGRLEILTQSGGPELPDVEPGWRVYWYAVLVEADLALGRAGDAEQWVLHAEREAARMDLPGRRSLAQRARAAFLLARGDAGAAAELALAAAEGFRSTSQPVEAGRADLLAGRALMRATEDERAKTQLERALAECVRCGAERDRAAAERELQRLEQRGDGGARSPAAGVPALSPRELEVASLVVGGLTNRGVAERLRLSEKTIESHLSSAYAKLGVTSRAALARILRPGA